jgi:hypothetical protein
MKELFERNIIWSNESIDQIKHNFLSNILNIKNQKAVEAAVNYAFCLNKIGVDNKNYPLFFQILSINHKYVINALLSSHNSFTFLNNIQPNFFIISTCFGFLSKFNPDKIYNKSLEVIYILKQHLRQQFLVTKYTNQQCLI